MLNSSDHNQTRERLWGLNPNVFFLGLVSLLTDISSEMIFTLLPLFLSNVLGAGAVVVGLVGGLSEGTDAILRIFSGWFSDRIGRRKPLALLGYGLSAVVKPFMILASNWGVVLAIRFGDRVGKGIRASPRDALVADSVSAGERGRGFGLHRAMDTLGAVVGLAVAAVIIYSVQGVSRTLGINSYQWLVLLGVVPAVAAVLVLTLFVREVSTPPTSTEGSPCRFTWHSLTTGFDTRFKLFLLVMTVFTLGNSSDFFVILRAQNLGSPLVHVVLMLVLFNITYAAVSLPAGALSDRVGRRRVISIGWGVYALVYLGFALASSLWQVWLLFASYGIYHGLVEGAARAFVADLVPEEKRGTAYGLYHSAMGLALLAASLIAGWLWESVGPASPFFLGAGFAFLAMMGMMKLIRE